MIEAFVRGALGDPFGKLQEAQTAHSDLQGFERDAREFLNYTVTQIDVVAARYGVVRKH
jgi:hypothetical protein